LALNTVPSSLVCTEKVQTGVYMDMEKIHHNLMQCVKSNVI
jgi:hypothetical protein